MSVIVNVTPSGSSSPAQQGNNNNCGFGSAYLIMVLIDAMSCQQNNVLTGCKVVNNNVEEMNELNSQFSKLKPETINKNDGMKTVYAKNAYNQKIASEQELCESQQATVKQGNQIQLAVMNSFIDNLQTFASQDTAILQAIQQVAAYVAQMNQIQ